MNLQQNNEAQGNRTYNVTQCNTAHMHVLSNQSDIFILSIVGSSHAQIICLHVLELSAIVCIAELLFDAICIGSSAFRAVGRAMDATVPSCTENEEACDVEYSDCSSTPAPVSPKGSQRSQRSLSQDVNQDLIQGIPFSSLLAGAGRSFNSGTPDVRVKRRLRRCIQFDAFISHDWGTSKRLKYGSLLLLFNAKAAAVATLLVSIAGGCLIHYQVLPNSNWAAYGGYLVFIVFLLFWQNIREMLLKPRLAFLDKFTIPQEDEELKEKCILGLAGFLTCSKKLIILWSESYIDRIWCIYELTTFMRLHGQNRPMEAIPVALPLLLLVHAAWWLGVRLVASLVWWNSEAEGENKRFLLVFISIGLMLFSTYPMQSYIGKRMTNTLQDLSQKIRNFDVHETKCFCCSQGHLFKGESIPCDRGLIYQNFLAQYQKSGEDTKTGLERFSDAVRQKFGDQILQACGGSRMVPLDLFIYVVFSMNTPFLISRIPAAFALAEKEASVWLACLVVTRELARWATLFPSMLVYLWANKMVWSFSHFQYGILTKVFLGLFMAVFVFASGFLTVLSVAWTPKDSFLPLIVFSFLLLLGFCLVDPRCRIPKDPRVWGKDIEAKGEADEEVKVDEPDFFSI